MSQRKGRKDKLAGTDSQKAQKAMRWFAEETSSDDENIDHEGPDLDSSLSSVPDPFADHDGDFDSDSNYMPDSDQDASFSSVEPDPVTRTNEVDPDESLINPEDLGIIQNHGSQSLIINHESMDQCVSPSIMSVVTNVIEPPKSTDALLEPTSSSFERLTENIKSSVQNNLPEQQPIEISIPGRSSSPVRPALFSQVSPTEQQPIAYSMPGRSSTPTSPVIQHNTSNSITDNEDWTERIEPIPNFTFDSASSGPQVPVNDTTTPIELLDRFLSQEIFELIVTYTNKYGDQLCNANRPQTRGSRFYEFKHTNVTEIKKFIGLCLLQAHIPAPSIRHLFTTADPLYYHPIFNYIISGRRFEQILRCLSVGDKGAKGMKKIEEFIAMLIHKFMTNYKPGQNLSLDESMLSCRGRLSFRQYMKNKKSKYGIKFYVLTTSDGYVLNFIIYEGKNTIQEGTLIKDSKIETIVLKLMEMYFYKGHNLYMDNFYNSVALAEKLLERRTHVVGTLRKDRKLNPKDLFNQRLKKGDHKWLRRKNIYASVWLDKRPVYMITTKHHPRLITTKNRFGHCKTKPIEVADYNENMSGIDKSDQMMSYYSTPKKSIRWYKKVIFHLVDMAVWNAFYIYKKHVNRKATLLSFRNSIIKQYLGVSDTLSCQDIVNITKKNLKQQKSSTAPVIQQTDLIHWPESIPVPEGKTRRVFLRCRMCTKNKKKKETSYRCKGCPGNPPLCPACFENWHNQ